MVMEPVVDISTGGPFGSAGARTSGANRSARLMSEKINAGDGEMTSWTVRKVIPSMSGRGSTSCGIPSGVGSPGFDGFTMIGMSERSDSDPPMTNWTPSRPGMAIAASPTNMTEI
jgi:hypothetical protein